MKSHKSLTIDGVDYTDDAQFDFVLKYSKTNDQISGFKYIKEMTFKGKAYDLLNETFFENFNKKRIFEIKITPNCCNTEFHLKIGYRDVKKCSCTVEANPQSNESDIYDRLKHTIWYGNEFESLSENLRYIFFGGGTWITVVFMIIYDYIIRPIIDIINKIDDLIGTGSIDKGPLEHLICGGPNYHLGYLFREILEFQLNFLGQKFQSSILQDGIYKNLSFMPANWNEGYDLAQNVNFDRANAPSYSVLNLVEILKDGFNAKCWLDDNTLRFERKNEYYKTNIILLNLVDEGISETLCYEFEDTNGYASANFKYNNDSLDSDGNQTAELYNDRVEWNKPSQPWQKGVKEVLMKDFSTSHFMRDGYSADIVDDLRTQITGRKFDLLLSNFRTKNPKLLLWDGMSKEDAHVTRIKPGKYYRYNQEVYFNELQSDPELYKEFHAIDDPNTYDEINSVGEIEWKPKNFCEAAEKIKKYGLRCGIKNTFVIEGVEVELVGLSDEEIEIDFETQIVKLGKVTWIHYK